jgi:hypothetical protein
MRERLAVPPSVALQLRANSIGFDARVTPPDPPRNAEAGATEQRGLVRPTFNQSARIQQRADRAADR